MRGNRGLCLPADPQFLAWLAERFSFSFFPCERPEGRRLPSALMREDGNGLSLALPDDLRNPMEVTVSDPSVVVASAGGGWLELSPRGRGSAEVGVTPSGGGEPVIAEVTVRAAVGTFGVDIVLEQPAPTGYEETVVTIADWWSSVLDGTEWPDRQFECMTDKVKALADDMLIYATTFYRSSSIYHTGYAALCDLHSGLPIGGELGMAYGFGHSRPIVAHEIGHHLGLVGIWPSHLVSEDGKYFIGSRAVEAYRAAGGDSTLPGVPMDGVHWGAGVKDWLLGGGTEIVISLSALADAGYTVDMAKSRPTGKPQTMAPSLDDDVVPVGPTALRRGAASDSAHHRPPDVLKPAPLLGTGDSLGSTRYPSRTSQRLSLGCLAPSADACSPASAPCGPSSSDHRCADPRPSPPDSASYESSAPTARTHARATPGSVQPSLVRPSPPDTRTGSAVLPFPTWHTSLVARQKGVRQTGGVSTGELTARDACPTPHGGQSRCRGIDRHDGPARVAEAHPAPVKSDTAAPGPIRTRPRRTVPPKPPRTLFPGSRTCRRHPARRPRPTARSLRTRNRSGTWQAPRAGPAAVPRTMSCRRSPTGTVRENAHPRMPASTLRAGRARGHGPATSRPACSGLPGSRGDLRPPVSRLPPCGRIGLP